MSVKNVLKNIKTTALASAIALTGVAMMSTAGADELDKIKEKGVLRIAMSGAYPPFNFVNDQNEVVGFDPAIGSEIAKRMGLEVEIITTAWDGIIAGLLANKYDAVVGSMSITEERQKVIDFVGPYYTTRRAMFTKPDSGIDSLEKAADKRMGVTLGETHEDWARAKDYSIRTYKGLPELLLELKNGRVDVIVNDGIAAILAIKENGYDFVQVTLPEAESQPISAGIAIRKGNPELAAAMQAALDALMEDGTYLKIAEEWIGADIR
ncbi:transporter substrate-binding domain-containing protein [Ostreibacterium oceani]|uniref:Transporter substrate-binding domain-containing protein n=1 Tax=Ostreibacterium oceani TaxID=2654998 RepID=A0A6N7F1U3_9GAMM|nr:transporter substrate-binding domain-containing protein [Ostreibacterium oceani]MPV86758.1 transporter substrate-binding domain-containing protein [Ostreibacterium oceani]